MPWMPHNKPHTYTTWYFVAMIPIKFILLSSMVLTHRATYVYIPNRFYAPYNANKSIFVYRHGFFISLYMFISTHIHNKQYCLPRIFYLYIRMYLHMSTYFFIYMYISIYPFVFSPIITVDRQSHSQCVLNRLPHAAHTTIPWITFCNVIMRFWSFTYKP